MSVIIRLQNLPWNANALDIRRYFQGLSIPDGGVHIIGGEKGDAFIAFSTDEDARQAMMKDAGAINGFPIKLLLSSKTEMQNVISAAKHSPLPPLPAASNIGVPKPVGFFDRAVVPPVGGAPVPFVGGTGGSGDVTGSGQGLRSSTGLGSLPPVPYGYPGNSSQVLPLQPAGSVMRMSEPRAMPAAPVMQQPAARLIFDTRPSDRPPVPGNFQQPPAAPLDPLAPGFRSLVAGPPPVGAWTSSQPPPSRDPLPMDFGRPVDIPGNQGAGFSALNPSAGREPVRLESSHLDANYPRNGLAYGAPEGGRNFIPAAEPGRSLGMPPLDVGRGEFGRGDGVPLGRPEEKRDAGRFLPDRPSWAEGDGSRLESRPGQDWSGGRNADNGSRREFARPDVDRGIPAPDRWLEKRNMGLDRGPRDLMPNEGPLSRPRVGEPNDRYSRPPVVSEGSGSRFGLDAGPPDMGRIADNRPRGDARGARFPHPEPGYREPPHQVMDEPLRRPPPVPDQHWMEDRRRYGPPGPAPGGPPPPGFDGRPRSPPRDRHFPGGEFPPRDERWHGDRRDFDPRQMRDPEFRRDLCVCAVNFPKTFNYREVRRFFQNCEIPRDGVKLINDRMGMRTGVAFIRFANVRCLNMALEMHGKMTGDTRVAIERCSDEDFDSAVDSAVPKRGERSRSPRGRQAEENSNLSYFVLKKLPTKTEKDDIRKFFGKFRIVADGGPFFELAFDKTQTGNALVAIEEKDSSKVLTLHRSLLNGARVDVIKVNSYEFEERSRRTRQCERDAGKDAGPSKTSSSSSFVPREKKVEKPDAKSKELDRGGNVAGEDGGRRPGGVDTDQRTHCIELRGVPYTASPALLQDFFREISIPAESVHIVYNREHRATGIAYIEFASLADQKRAMEKDKQHIGHRVIEIRALSRAAMVDEYNRQQQKFGGTAMALPSPRPNPKQGSSEALLSMQNLHYDTQLEDILEFFSGYHPIVDSIKLQYKDQLPTGDGLIAFPSLQEAESALRNKNRHLLLGKPITLSWAKN